MQLLSNKIDMIKKLLFWPQIRKQMILHQHKETARYCHSLMDEYYNNPPMEDFVPKKSFKGKKLIWQYWGQGFSSKDLPPIVSICFESVDRFCNTDEYEIIRLSDETISEYIDFPKDAMMIKNKLPKFFFSDLLRCCLLTVYGGCWLDATVLITGKIPQKYWEYDFFMYQRDDREPHKRYWENAFAYYYGWQRTYKVRVLNSIFFCKKNNVLITDLRNILLLFLSREENLPNYFFFQILFNELIETRYKDSNCPLEGDCLPHYLQQIINDDKFDIASVDETLKMATIHKLTYKSKNCSERLSLLLNK